MRRGKDSGEGGDKGAEEGDGTAGRFLYDNEKDPYQMKNIAGDNLKQTHQLHQELIYWLERTRDPELDRFKSM